MDIDAKFDWNKMELKYSEVRNPGNVNKTGSFTSNTDPIAIHTSPI